jgi:hypothetical protein
VLFRSLAVEFKFIADAEQPKRDRQTL